ncbi:MAG: hypothetical protein LUC85_00615 [Bacteroidales bacterium]|nr:hypothetical protein [Bacteroidales bacterium]
MTWKSEKRRRDIRERLYDIIRGLIASEVSETEMQAFILFYDREYNYTEIAWELNLNGWEEARTLVHNAAHAINRLDVKYPFDESLFLAPEDEEDAEEDM